VAFWVDITLARRRRVSAAFQVEALAHATPLVKGARPAKAAGLFGEAPLNGQDRAEPFFVIQGKIGLACRAVSSARLKNLK